MRRRPIVKPTAKRPAQPPQVREVAPKPPVTAIEPVESARQGTDMTDEQIDKMLKAAYT